MGDGTRTISIPLSRIRQWIDDPQGMSLICPMKVGWPELQLTLDQIAANAMARLDGQPEPYPDHSLFLVEVTRDVP